MTKFLIAIVDFARRNAVAVIVASLLLTTGALYLAANHLGIDTDTSKLFSPDLPWRKAEIAYTKAFPQDDDFIAIVIDGKTPDQTDAAASALADALRREPELFKTVRRPDGGVFFQKNGLMFLPKEDIQNTVNEIIAAQPMIASLAQDPSLRGLFKALSLVMQGVTMRATMIGPVEPALHAIAGGIENAVAHAKNNTPLEPLSWDRLFTGRAPLPEELRRFVLTQPVLDYGALAPGGKASAEIRALAKQLRLTPDQGVQVRLTGPIPLSDEEFSSVAQGIGIAAALSVTLVIGLLFIGLKSFRIVLAILITLFSGLIVTAGFAAAAVGNLNLISVAFAVLFVGIAVDFGIQFSVRYRDERYREPDFAAALRGTAGIAGLPIVLAAITTAAGFLSFLPTDYRGVKELGLIAGFGMVVALAGNMTLLPALLTLFRPGGEKAPVGYRFAAPLDRFLLRHRRAIILGAAVIALVGLALAPRLTFDFNPLDLKDPHTESMSTMLDLMKNPETSPYTLDVMTPSIEAAAALQAKLETLPSVARTVSLASYVPEDQDQKLAILSDAETLVGPSLEMANAASPPDDAAVLASLAELRARLNTVAAANPHSASAAELGEALDRAAALAPKILPDLQQNLIGELPNRLTALKLALSAEPVGRQDLPPELVQDWITADGRARIEVFPKGDGRNNVFLKRFVAEVRAVAPDVTGPPISIQSSAATITHAFAIAGVLALLAIAVILALVLRRVRDVALVLAPLLLAALMTMIAAVVIGLSLNFANIIVLPLLLGIGVAFDVYFVTNWRAGLANPLQSATTRAVIFSAATTASAFGSLALSHHRGTSEMGILLSLSLFFTLASTLIFLPALLGPPRSAAD